jgi:endogenous inhibitor of DNA gyrase (YacG/DUF329 family)
MDLVRGLLLAGVLFALVWVASAVVTAALARRRGGPVGQWVFLGFLLGPIGLLLVLRVMAHCCPHCRAPVLRGVRRCPRCGEEVPRLEDNPVGPLWTYRRDW